MILSLVTGLEVKHPRIKTAEQTILTLIGCKVICPKVFHWEIDEKIKQLESAIRLLKEDPTYQEYLTNLIRENRKFIDRLLDEVLPL